MAAVDELVGAAKADMVRSDGILIVCMDREHRRSYSTYLVKCAVLMIVVSILVFNLMFMPVPPHVNPQG